MQRPVLLVCLTLAVCAGIAQASPMIYTLPLDNAPIKITNIASGWKPPDWAPAAHKAALKDIQLLPIFMQYTNQAQKPIEAVRFMCAFYDPFNDYLDSLRLVSVDTIAVGGLDYGRWQCPGRDVYLTSTMIIYPGWVRFKDGTVWRVDQADAVKKASTAPDLNFEAWHISGEPKEYIAQKLKDRLPVATP